MSQAVGAARATGQAFRSNTWRFAWTLRGPGEDVTVIRRGDQHTDEAVRPVLPSEVASWLADPVNRTVVNKLFAADTGRPGIEGGPLHLGEHFEQVCAAVNEAFRCGRLLVVGAPPQWSIITRPGAAESEEAPGQGGTGKQQNEKKTWIEIRLINKKGQPVAGAKYRLKITDGSIEEGTTDEFGSVRVTGIDPGMCEVSFPEFDAQEWKKV
jgi:hypothetical protein